MGKSSICTVATPLTEQWKVCQKLTQKRRVDSGPPCVLPILDEQVYVELLIDYKGAANAAAFALGRIHNPHSDGP